MTPAQANWQLAQMDSVLTAMKERERLCLDSAVAVKLRELAQPRNRTIGDVAAADSNQRRSCPSTFDGFICWPEVPAGASLSLACPSGVFLGGRASRRCRSDGAWDSRGVAAEFPRQPEGGNLSRGDVVIDNSYTNYSECQPTGLHSAVARLMRATQVSQSSQQMRIGLERWLCQNLALAKRRQAVARSPECPPAFDSALCWPATPAGRRVFASCPDYVNNVDRTQLAWRTCLPNGTWLWPVAVPHRAGGSAEGWTNFSECSVQRLNDEIPLHVINLIHMMGHVGYGISLAFLQLAIVILSAFRRLHCQRNAIHINMFFAFCLRALSHFVTYFLLSDEQIIPCRINQSLMTYSVLTSFTWVFVEALHLYMLIFVNAMSDSKLSTVHYLVIGWGTPCVFTLIWVILRIALDNSECWRTYQPMGADIWLVNLYLCLLVFTNAGLFARIVKELFVKMKSQPRSSTAVAQSYRKLWKSTCVLVIVFGIYYLIFLPMSIIPKDRLGATLDYVKLFYEHFFNSFQGFFVSLLFCFANLEVHKELKRLLLRTRAGQWLKSRGFLKPLEDVYGLEPENRRNNRRRARLNNNDTENAPLQNEAPVAKAC